MSTKIIFVSEKFQRWRFHLYVKWSTERTRDSFSVSQSDLATSLLNSLSLTFSPALSEILSASLGTPPSLLFFQQHKLPLSLSLLFLQQHNLSLSLSRFIFWCLSQINIFVPSILSFFAFGLTISLYFYQSFEQPIIPYLPYQPILLASYASI